MATATTSRTRTAGLELVPLRGRVSFAPLALRPGRHMLGADAGCDLCLALEGVAPQHCLIIAGPQKTLVKALSPLTWINDGPCGESVLKAGDRLVIGPVELLARAVTSVDEEPAVVKSISKEPVRQSDAAPSPPPLPSAARSSAVPAVRLADVTTPRSLFQSEPAWQSAPTEGANAFPTPPPLPVTPPPLPLPVGGEQGEVLAERERRLADQERKLAEAEQERRLLARKLDEAQERQDREGKLSAELERERTLVRALRAELNETRAAATRQSAASDEVLGLRSQVESLTQKLASARPATPEADRSGLLQQRMELLAMRRDVQESLAEQHRLENEIEEARQALLRDAEGFRKQQEAAQEEFVRLERVMAELEQHRGGLTEREQTLSQEFARIAGLEADVSKRSGEIDEREQGLVARRSELDGEHDRLQAVRAEAAEIHRRQQAIEAREGELDRIAEQLEQELQHAERTAEQHRNFSMEVEALRRELDQRERSVRAEERNLAARQTELEASASRLEQAHVESEQRLRDHAARDEARQSARALLDEQAAAHEQAAQRLEERMSELAAREQHVASQASAVEERHRILSLADTAATSSADEIELSSELRAELERRAEELRQEEVELAEARAFVASRERAIEARLLEIEERETRIAREAASDGGLSSVTSLDAGPSIERDLEEARLSAESLAHREQEVSGKIELIQEREAALDELETSLRRREFALDEREEQAGWSVPAPAPAIPSPSAPDVDAISRELEQAYEEQVAALEAERAEIEQLRGELKDHRTAFLEQYEALEQERTAFELDRQELEQERLQIVQERAGLEAEREALEYERHSAAAPFVPESREAGRFGTASFAHPAEPLNESAPHPIPPAFPFAARPSLSARPSLEDSELESPPPHTAPFAPRPSLPDRPSLQDPELLGGRFFPEEIGRRLLPAEPAPEEQGEFEDEPDPRGTLATTLIEDELAPEPAVPAPQAEAPSSDAMELRAHLADLFGIDLSRRRSSMLSVTEPAEAPVVETEPDQYVEEDYAAAEAVAEEPELVEPLAPIEEPPLQEDDVASYMERLLKRTRTGAVDFQRPVAPPPPPPPPPPAASTAPSEVAPPLQEEAARPVRRPLQQQEKDAIRGSMDSFRELANRTARAAVARHQLVKLRQTLSTKGMLAGFCTVVTVILVVPEIWGSDRYRIAAIAAAVVTSIAGMEWLRTKIRIKKLDDFVAESDISKDPPLEEEPADA